MHFYLIFTVSMELPSSRILGTAPIDPSGFCNKNKLMIGRLVCKENVITTTYANWVTPFNTFVFKSNLAQLSKWSTKANLNRP